MLLAEQFRYVSSGMSESIHVWLSYELFIVMYNPKSSLNLRGYTKLVNYLISGHEI